MIKTLTKIGYSLLLLLALTACGGGGGSSAGNAGGPPNTPAYTKATVKIALDGTLPAGTNISGAGVTITLPSGVTVDTLNNGDVVSGVVTPSGIFATGTQTPPIYVAANGGAAATLKIGLASGNAAGEGQTGEMVTIVFDLANGAAPTASSFTLSDLTVVDAATYSTIAGLSGSITSVALQ